MYQEIRTSRSSCPLRSESDRVVALPQNGAMGQIQTFVHGPYQAVHCAGNDASRRSTPPAISCYAPRPKTMKESLFNRLGLFAKTQLELCRRSRILIQCGRDDAEVKQTKRSERHHGISFGIKRKWDQWVCNHNSACLKNDVASNIDLAHR